MDQFEKRLEYLRWEGDKLNKKFADTIIEKIEENINEEQIINNITQLVTFQISSIDEKKMVADFKAIPLCLEQEKFKVAKFLVEQSQDNERQIPLLHYIIRERFDIDNDQFVDLLNKTGIDINEQDQYGATPLHYAAKNNNIEAIKLLMDEGADLLIEKMGKIKPVDFAKDESVKRVFEDYQKRKEAFAMINHPRLGEKSPGLSIEPDIVKLILDQQYKGR